MASPTVQNGAPNTPPPSDPAIKNGDSRVAPLAEVPATSLDDDGSAKRPRDARLLHIVLHNLGVQSYQERVPLQLLDFAYRYTSSILSDALRLSAEGYSGQTAEKKRGPAANNNDESSGITVTALRQAIASRQGDAFQAALPKEYMLEQAAERNRIALPKVERGYGLQLPEEKYCLTGVGWGLKEEWDDIDEDDLDEPEATVNGINDAVEDEDKPDLKMSGIEEEDADDDEEGAGKMEDVFGEEAAADEDDAMAES